MNTLIRLPDEIITHIYAWVAWPHAIMTADEELIKYMTSGQRLALDVFRIDRRMDIKTIHIVAYVTNRLSSIKRLGVPYNEEILDILTCIKGRRQDVNDLPTGVTFGTYSRSTWVHDQDKIRDMIDHLYDIFDINVVGTQPPGSARSIANDIYFSNVRKNKPHVIECHDIETLCVYLRRGFIDHVYYAMMSCDIIRMPKIKEEYHAMKYMISILLKEKRQ